MKIVATNRDAAAHRCSTGNLDVQPGTTRHTVGRFPQEAAFEMDQSTYLFGIACQFDPSDAGYTQITYWLAKMNATATGHTSITTVGFTIKDATDTTTQSVAEPVGLALFDDAACTIPSKNAVISAVTTGSAWDGVGTNAIEAVTSAGIVAATATATGATAAPFTVYARAFSLGSKSSAGASTHIMDSTQTQELDFT